MKFNKITSVLIFLLSIISTINAKNLVNQVKVVNKPPFVANKNLIVASYPDSQIVITLNAIDPENQGVFAILKNKNIGDNIRCYVRNSIQIICSIPNIPLSKSDTCSVNTNEGIKNLPYCKEYNIQYYLKDNGYAGEPPAVSPVYNVKLRVAKEVKLAMSNNSKLSAKDIDYRNYFYKLKGNFAVSSYNKDTIANILPTNMKKQYGVVLNTADKSNLLNNKIIGNSQAVASMKNAVSGTNTQYLISKANTITSGTAVTSAPIYCTIKRAGIVGSSAYVCSLDPLLSINPTLATKYSYDESNMASQKNALSQCETACKENVKCNDVSSNIYYTLIKNKNYITSDIANQNQTDKTYSVKSLKIVERDSNGNLIGSIEIPISNATLNDFYWIINNKMSTTHNVGGIELNCGFRSDLDIKTYIQDNSFYVEPQQTCYIKQENSEYPRVNDSTLYTFKFLYYQPQFTCPVSGVHIVYEDRKTCENNCIYQGQCLTIRNPLAKIDEHIVNNCKDTTLINGEKLSDAVAKGQCKLVDEVSLDSQGNIEKYFVKNGAVVDPLRDNIGFSQSSSILKKENAIEMLGSFLDMNRKGKDDQRISYIDINNTLIGFNNKPVTNRNWDALTSIYDVKDYNASASILLKISPSLIKDIENEKLDAGDYAILPIFMVVNKQDYGEKQTYLKTYYLLNLNDFNMSNNTIHKFTYEEPGTAKVILGKYGDNYLSGWCSIYKYEAKFWISSLKDVKSFKLKTLDFDDYEMLTINGHVIKVGPYGGNMLKIVNGSVEYAPGKYGSCELGTSWRRHYNEDVKWALKPGLNTAEITLEVSGGGEGYAVFEANLSNINDFQCKGGECSKSIENSQQNITTSVNTHVPRILNEFLFLKRDAVIYKKDNSVINPDDLLYKLSDGTWGITINAYKKYKALLNYWGLKYTILIPDSFLQEFGKNSLLNKIIYFRLPYKKSIVGVTNFNYVKESYNQFLEDEKNYPPKERNFNTYKIKMDNSYSVYTVNVSSIDSNNEFKYKNYYLIRVGNKLYLDKNNNGILDPYDGYPLKVSGWYFNLKANLTSHVDSVLGFSGAWASDNDPLYYNKRISETLAIGYNWADTPKTDWGGGIYAKLNYPVKMKFSFAGDDYHAGMAVYNNDKLVSCYKLNVGDAYNCGKSLPDYKPFSSKTNYISKSNLATGTGNYFVMFYRDGGDYIDKRDWVRVDFETTNVEPPFKWAIPKNPVICPKGFINDNGFCELSINSNSVSLNGLISIEQEFGKNYNPNNLQIGSLINKWELDPKKIDINAYVKDINLWKYLRKGNTLLPQWLAKINFDSFENGKLFLIFDKKKNIGKIINNIKEKGFGYLTKLLENDFDRNKKYLAWDMDNRYTNSIIYNGNNTYRGFESTNVNKFINYFGLTSYDTLCPENFYFNGHVCVYNKNNSLLATAFPDYFTNQLEDKNGPLYAAYNRDTLLIRMVPKTGIKPFEANVVCPKGYSYDKYLKECVKHANLKDCTAPNGSYDFEHQVCIAEATCSNGGFFDSTLGKCIKLSPANYTGENGYYFIFEQDKNAYDMFTPLTTHSKYTCYFNEYKCPLNGSIFNSKDTCDLMCFNVVNGKRVYGNCQKVTKIKKDSYNDEQTCNFQCEETKNSFNWYGNLIIKGNSLFNKYSNVSIYHNGNLVSNGNVIDNKFSFGNGSLIVKDVKPGDEVKIVISSKWTGLQYANGLAYWNDVIGVQTKTVGDKKCFLLNKYYTPQNEITIGLDVDGDNYSDSQVQIPTFYCLSNNPFEKTITIKVLGTGLDVNYYDTFLNNKDKKATLSFRDKGICVASSDKSQNTLIPFFETMISNDFINNVSVSTLNRYFPPYSYYGIKDNNIDKEKVLAFKKHFCYYPLQQEYDLIKNYSFVNNISDLFNLYKYYDSCPSYFDGNVKMLRLSNDDNKKAVYKLGVERISKNLLDLNIYNPLQIYNAINKYHIVTLPSGKGVYMEDNYFIKIPHIGRGRKIWIGYGYSPFKDCVSIDGQSVKTNTVYAPMTNCNFAFGSWTYDSSIKKCISNPTSNGCTFGELVNGKCELNPICPEGYIPDGSGRCEKIIVQTYQTNRKICKPWWTLRRKYICNGINGIGSYIFGLPRWITIEKVPVYRYEEYNFNDN